MKNREQQIDLDTELSLSGNQLLQRVMTDLKYGHMFHKWFQSCYTDTRDFYDLPDEDQEKLKVIFKQLEDSLTSQVEFFFMEDQ